MGDYDCTEDVRKHKRLVRKWLDKMIGSLEIRKLIHDDSKLRSPEKELFDKWTPRLKELEFGGEEYEAALEQMRVGLKHHYQANQHHPEHYENGIDGMSLMDVVEMVADWMAAAEGNGNDIDLEYLANRFKLDGQLVNIIANTLYRVDWKATQDS